MLLMLLLPPLLQLSLGGFLKGSAVTVWAFAAPMLALLYRRANEAWPWFVGFVAVVLATTNVVGGFVVTDRMLEMFKGRRTDAPRR